MKIIKHVCIGIFTLSMAACNSSSSNNSENSIDEKYQGIWQAPEYGSVFHIMNNKVNAYAYTTNYCLLEDANADVSTNDIERVIRLTEANSQLELFGGYGTETFSAPGMTYKKINELPEACQTNLLHKVGTSGYQQNYEQDLAIFHELFKNYYFDFETKNVDIDNLYHTATQKLTSETTEEELLNIMVEMVAPLADTHIQVINSEGIDVYNITNKPTLPQILVEEFAALNDLPFPIPVELLSETLIDNLNAYITQMYALQWELINNYARADEEIKTAENGLLRWFENEGIGYLYIGAMTGYSNLPEDAEDIEHAQDSLNNLNAALNLALNDLSNTQGLILDIRTNNGGSDYISLAIASRFVSASNTHIYSKQARLNEHRSPLADVYINPSNEIQYLSPVILLTSANTISAAETFTLSMKQLNNVTIVGEATQGSFSDILSFHLPNNVEIGLSNEFYLSPTGEWFEHTGVPVDVEVPFFTLHHRALEVDAGIEMAIELLTQ
ncbi:S41 family peptidase [Thalassotalea agariperforans]